MDETLARGSARVGLLDRHGFAGQRGLDDEQVLGGEEPHVAGNHVAGGELHHVAGDELLERDFPRLPVAHDGGGDADHRLELGRGACRPASPGRSAEETPRPPSAASPCRRGHRRCNEGYRRQDGQQNHQRVAGGEIEPLQPALMPLPRDLVGAVLLQARAASSSLSPAGEVPSRFRIWTVLSRRIDHQVGRACAVRILHDGGEVQNRPRGIQGRFAGACDHFARR